ncbi:MAG: S41 family peptidase, partial [Candidatus Zixiibacteriota bacterium]
TGATAELEAALDSLLKGGWRQTRGLVLDLRDNPGGLFSEAYAAANLFLEEGAFIVGTAGRSRWDEAEYSSDGSDITGGLPMAIIVNRGSASASEIVAGALQLAGRAVLVGDTTYGKGLVQRLYGFPGGYGVRLTIARYYLADGIYITPLGTEADERWLGLAPDYHVSLEENIRFVRALERSLLLYEFAARHDSEIVEAAANGGGDGFPERFTDFAARNGFGYESATTAKAVILAEQSAVSSNLKATVRVANLMAAESRQVDRQEFAGHADYIRMRLRQIAYERVFGAYRAYKEVYVPEDRAIQQAIGVLASRHVSEWAPQAVGHPMSNAYSEGRLIQDERCNNGCIL